MESGKQHVGQHKDGFKSTARKNLWLWLAASIGITTMRRHYISTNSSVRQHGVREADRDSKSPFWLSYYAHNWNANAMTSTHVH